MKKITTILLILILAVSLTACGSATKTNFTSQMSATSVQDSADFGSKSSAATSEGVFSNGISTGHSESVSLDATAAPQQVAAIDRKIIKTASMSIETTTFDKTVDTIMEKVKAMGGYMESTNISGFGVNANNTQ